MSMIRGLKKQLHSIVQRRFLLSQWNPHNPKCVECRYCVSNNPNVCAKFNHQSTEICRSQNGPCGFFGDYFEPKNDLKALDYWLIFAPFALVFTTSIAWNATKKR